MTEEIKVERTLVLLKPDAVQRGLIGKLVGRFEDKGFKIVGMKLMMMTDEIAAQHYAEHVEKYFYGRLVNFMTGGPLVAMVLEGTDAVTVSRKLMGSTYGLDAEAGTIRGDFGISKGFNLVHGSDSAESAKREISIFFKEEEILDYNRSNDCWIFSGD